MSAPVNAPLANEAAQPEDLSGPPAANCHRLPDERTGITHHFSIAGHEGYLTVGLYPNGNWVKSSSGWQRRARRSGGLMECFGIVVSVSLQHGVPLQVLVGKLSHTRFETSGWTGKEQLDYAKSIMDYLFRWLELRFLAGTQLPLFATAAVPDVNAGGRQTRRLAPASQRLSRMRMR
jgi:ribonucleoside-diphosphate reductase alpha chain